MSRKNRIFPLLRWLRVEAWGQKKYNAESEDAALEMEGEPAPGPDPRAENRSPR